MALEKIELKDLPQAYRSAFTRAQEVIRNGSYEYGVELLKDILKVKPGFWDAREAIRDAQREKTEHLGGFGKFIGGFSANKFLIKGKALLKKNPLEALQCAEEALSRLYNIPGLKLVADAALELEANEVANAAAEAIVRLNTCRVSCPAALKASPNCVARFPAPIQTTLIPAARQRY